MCGVRCRDTKAPLDAGVVLSQSLTFMIAGYETTSTAVGYAIAMISQHPAVEARLLEEINAHLGLHPTQTTLAQWPYAMVRVPCLCEHAKHFACW
jgi:cytochrome P450